MKNRVLGQFKIKVNKTMQGSIDGCGDEQTEASGSTIQEQAKQKNALEDPVKHEQNYFANLEDGP